MESWRVGDSLLGLYQILEILGEGGMGTVYRVLHTGWQMELALKVPKSSMFNRPGGAAAFTREAQTWVNLGLHPHVVSCYYVRSVQGIPCIFAELANAGNLAQWLRNGRLYEGDAHGVLHRLLDVAIQMAWGLQHAHRHELVHGDVKPSNVVMSNDGLAKVTDFGLAQAAHRGRTHGETAPLTVSYASPEQLSEHPLTFSADIWSWGVSVLELFTNTRPRFGSAAAFLLEQFEETEGAALPRRLLHLLHRCFRDELGERPSDFEPVVETLLACYEEELLQPYPRPLPSLAGHIADDLNNRSISLLDLGDEAAAVEVLRGALRIDPGHLFATYNLALLSWRTGARTDVDIVNELRQLQATHGTSWHIPWLLAWTHLERGDVGSARLAWVDAQRLAATLPDMPDAEGFELVETLAVQGGFVHSVSFSPDATRIVSGSEDGTVKLWSAAERTLLRSWRASHRPIVGAVFAGPGEIAVADADGIVTFWEESGRKKRGPLSLGTVLSVDASGRWMGMGVGDGRVGLWDVARECCVAVPVATDSAPRVASVAPGGTRVAVGYERGELVLWDATALQSGQVVAHAGAVSACLWADSTTLVSGGADGIIRVWDAVSGDLIREMAAHREPILNLAYTAHGDALVSCSTDHLVRCWHLATGRCMRTFGGGRTRTNAVAVSPVDARLVMGTADASLIFYGWPGRLEQAPVMVSRPQASEAAANQHEAFSQARHEATRALKVRQWESAVVAARKARTVPGYERHPQALSLWDQVARRATRGALREAWPLWSVEAHADGALALSVSPAADHSITGGGDGVLRWWDSAGTCLRALAPVGGPILKTMLSEDGYAVTLAFNGRVQAWHLPDGVCLWQDDVRGTDVMAVGTSLVGVSTSDGTVVLRDIRSGEVRLCLEVAAVCLGATVDAGYLATGTLDGSIQVWDTARGSAAPHLRGHIGPVRGVVFDFAQRFLMSAGEDATLRRAVLVQGVQDGVFKGHKKGVLGVALSLDGRVAVSGAKDRSLRVWDVETGKLLTTLAGHSDWVTGVAISADGRLVTSAARDGTLRRWFLDWELSPPPTLDWDPCATPWLAAFGRQCRTLGLSPDSERIMAVLEICGFGHLHEPTVYQEYLRLGFT